MKWLLFTASVVNIILIVHSTSKAPKCGCNEYFDPCANGGCEARTCKDLNRPNNGTKTCVVPIKCIKGCVCKNGLVRNYDGDCVQKNKCPKTPKCGCDEYLDPCANGGCYEARTCKDVQNRPNGTKICVDPIKCIPGCLCKDGRVRNNKGDCVTKNKCPKISCNNDTNAQPGCGNNCGRLCSNYNKGPVACTLECKPNGCDCKKGYVFDTNTGKCCLPEHCTKVCGKNETYTSCVEGGCYGARNCSEISCGRTVEFKCVLPKKCTEGCICKEGYLRNRDGNCVRAEDCMVNAKCCPGKNEKLDMCPSNCMSETCADRGKVLDYLPQAAVCKPRCVCLPGFLRDCNGTCIPENQCDLCNGDTNATCGCGCSPTCADHFAKRPPRCNKICKVGACDCKPGYVLEPKSGKCILPKDCPVKCTGPHEYYSCGSACDNVCSLLSVQNKTNCPIMNIKCNDMCYCKDGYARDDNNTCVPIGSCPPTPTCGPDEYLDPCSNGGCYYARTCDHLDLYNGTAMCMDPINCMPGCLCKGDLLKNKEGKCVPENECPNSKCKGDHETYMSFHLKCIPETCDDLGFPLDCDFLDTDLQKPEKPECVCRYGYVKDMYGKCIPVGQCPSCGGDRNATAGCGKNCGRLCSNYNKGPVFCTLECKLNGCDCKKGYVFDTNTGKCGLPEHCTPVCGQNETYTSCVEGGCYGARNCSEISCGRTVPVKCVKPIKCTGGCICKEGYLRNKHGHCVLAEDCTVNDNCCPVNEKFHSCPSNCMSETCAGRGQVIHCLPQAAVCTPRCLCLPGFLRDCNGTCIPENQCDSCNGDKNAKCGCGCSPTCADHFAKRPPRCNKMCKVGACDCKPGYVLEPKSGKCILPKDCPVTCPKNEIFLLCPNPCPPQNCSVDERVIRCAAPPQIGDPACNPSCTCIEGYKRNDTGICIPKEQCPITCPKNEIFLLCPNPCPPQNCSVDERVIRCAAPPQIGDPACNPSCTCIEGYKRNDTGICIPKEQCPTYCNKDPNSEPGCGINCGRLCSNYDKGPVFCPAICLVNGCDCKKGFVMDTNTDKCVLPSQCTKVCGQNETYTSCVEGGCYGARNCSEISCGRTVPVKCVKPIKCTGGCICKEGYLRNKHGHCVRPEDCMVKDQCGKNEVCDKCLGDCPPRICGINDAAVLCAPINPADCKPGCRCRDGYSRNDQNECIETKDCPPTCDGANEVYVACSSCDPDTCESIGKEYHCPLADSKSCKGACMCKPGYSRNKKEECILDTDCQKCTGPHEYHSCGGACDNVCSLLSVQNQTHCPIVNIKCNEMCYCEDGYARDYNNTCVPIASCPPYNYCPGINEKLDMCPSNCMSETCAGRGQVLDCPPKAAVCTPRCVCLPGFLRDCNGTCIPENQCDSPKCGPDEYLDPCSNGGCHGGRTCKQVAQFNGSKICIDPIKCIPGCLCKDGRVRNDEKFCVPKNKCPKMCNGDTNSTRGCGCSPTCADYFAKRPPLCNKMCKVDGCDCKPGYVLEPKSGKCILPKDCPDKC